jgi:GTP-binding protein
VERTRLLLHLIDGLSEKDPWEEFAAINRELAEYSPELAERPQLVVLTKMDLQEARDKWPALKRRAEEEELPAFAISSATREGVQELMNETARRLSEIWRDEVEQQKRLTAEVPAAGVVLRPEPEDAFTVEEMEDGFRVRGRRIERMVAMTDTESAEAMERLERQLRRLGVTDLLEQAGVMPGDHVYFGKVDLTWGEEM